MACQANWEVVSVLIFLWSWSKVERTNSVQSFLSFFSFFLMKTIGNDTRNNISSVFSIHGGNILFISVGDPSVQFNSVAQSCLTLCDPMNRSMPGLPVHHHLPEFTQTHVHQVRDAIQPSHPLSSPSSPAPNPSQHQSLFKWVNSSHEAAKLLEFQL